ncbi:MAG TPA: penicillin-binding protein 2, partial [Candidatus Eisenbacteria bacterium]|nr:penicillin-binding protein 2 [Candidatus Eisenbacteria bacterium]
MSIRKSGNRPRHLAFVAVGCFALLLFNLFRMQVLRYDHYRQLSEKNRIRVIYLEGPRGRVVDRHGQPLAENRLSFNCSVIPREASGRIAQSCRIVGPVLGEEPAALERRFHKRKAGAFNTVILAEDITPSQAMALEERLDSLPGFIIETRPQRQYPLKEAAAHLVGYIGPLNTEEADTLELYDYSPADWVGRDGVERNYEGYLRGRSGGLQIEVNNRGQIVKALGVKEPEEGKGIQLTVDAGLQEFAQSALGGQKGAVAVMDLKDGGLLCVNSAPSFDPNLFASTTGRRGVSKFLTDERAPMVDRAIRSQCPPGSIYKIVTALAALKRKKINERSSVDCKGFVELGGNRFHCWKAEGHGPQSMEEAFAHSCNAYFYTVGVAAGLDALLDRATELGFGERTGVDLPGEKKGFLPSRDWKRRLFHQPWYDGETANLSIGQGYLQVTPMQALVMVSAAARNGEVLTPHVIDRVNGVKVGERSARTVPAEPSHWRAVRRGLEAVVNSDSGTGRLARLEGVRVAGKTGTAQSGTDKTHAWFVGYAPAEDPKVAMVVFLEHGGRGGVNAAGVAVKVF